MARDAAKGRTAETPCTAPFEGQQALPGGTFGTRSAMIGQLMIRVCHGMRNSRTWPTLRYERIGAP